MGRSRLARTRLAPRRARASIPARESSGWWWTASARTAWIVPLQVEKSSEWSADPTLPFMPPTGTARPADSPASGPWLPNSRAVPERFAFTIRDLLGRHSNGQSMDVAGVLAVVREANSRPLLLSRACAVVQPDGDNLVPVASVRPKLEAFCASAAVEPYSIGTATAGGSRVRRRLRSLLGGGFPQGSRRVSGS